MTDDDLKAYDAAAAALERVLRDIYPEYTWHIPTSWSSLFSEANKEDFYAGRLRVYVTQNRKAAYTYVTVGMEQDQRVIVKIGQHAINILETIDSSRP